MGKKLQWISTLFKICFSIGIYILLYLLVISALSGIPVLHQIPSMYLNALGMTLAAAGTVFTISKEEYVLRIEKSPIVTLLAVAILAYSASAFFNILLGLIPWQNLFESNVIPNQSAYFNIPLWARMLCYEVVAPISEELLFRQVIFKRLKNIIPVWSAVLISAALFGIYHGNLVQGIYAFIMGILLAMVYEWTGSFVAPVVFHMVANHVPDICYEYESLGKVIYSLPGAVVWMVLMTASIIYILKKQNKCSKKTLHSS